MLFFAPRKAGYRFYHLNIIRTNNFFEVIALLPLILFSVVAGLIIKGVVFYSFLLTDVLESSHAIVLVEFSPTIVKVLPPVFIAIGAIVGALGQEKIAQIQQTNAVILHFVQSRYYYDNLINKLSLLVLKLSTKIYLVIDKGVLEWVGPRGLIPALY